MIEILWALLSLDYLALGILSYSTIETYHLDDFACPVRLYDPLYSELFSFENVLLLMIIAGAVLANQAKKHTDANISIIPNHIAVFFAVTSVPVMMATKGLLTYDTAYFAFILFFSTLLLLCFIRNYFFANKKSSINEYVAVLVILAVTFIVYEPWYSPSLKLKRAIQACDTAKFASLANKYPDHVRMNSHLLSVAFENPVFEIIKTIVLSDNKSMDSDFMDSAIFDQSQLKTLEYLYSQGINLASMDILRNAVSYTAKKNRNTGKNQAHPETNKNYPVLDFLIKLYREAPEDSRQQKHHLSGGCGFSSLTAIAAMAGDVDLMTFLASEGFRIDEEVIQALTLNKHIEKPEILALLKKTEFGEAIKPETVNNEQIATLTGQLPATDGFDLIMTSGYNVKSYRENESNIFHFLGENWGSRNTSEAFNTGYSDTLFATALQRKIDINRKNKNGITPLWVALEANNIRALVKFLANGADQNIHNPAGLSMREFCLKNNRLVLLSLLEEEGKSEKQ